MGKYGTQIELSKSDRLYMVTDNSLPEKIRVIKKPPASLYYLGKLPDPNLPTVAIIGSRNCTKYGEIMAQWFAFELAKAGVQIISGMAKGIDGIASMASLKAGGNTFGVLGCGVDVCYPTENKELYEKLKLSGGLISEYPPGTKGKPEYFPARNRIISGFADAILVIEAKQKSGTLITVDHALDQGKEVFAIPGNLDNPSSVGCNVIISQGGNIALSPDNIIDYLNGMVRIDGRTYTKRLTKDFAKVADNISSIHSSLSASELNEQKLKSPVKVNHRELLVCGCISNNLVTLQQLYERLVDTSVDIKIHELMNILMRLRLSGLVKQTEANLYYIANDMYPKLEES